jgi:hypothetical protein
MIITVAANDGAASWRDADEVGVVEVLLAVGAGLVLGTVAVLLERGHGSDEPARAPGPATIGPGAGEHAVWVGHASSPGMALAGALGALGLAAGGLFADGAPGWIMAGSGVVVGLAITWVSLVRVTASERGLRIAFGPLGYPVKQMPLARIERAGFAVTVDEPAPAAGPLNDLRRRHAAG